MKIYKLNQIVFSLQNNPAEFLQGLTTNTAISPVNAFVNIHGRTIAVAAQIKISDQEILLVIEPGVKDALSAHLDRYLKLTGTKLQQIEKNVYFDLESSAALADGDKIISQKQGRLIITGRTLSSNVSNEEFTLFRLAHSIPLQGVDYTDDFILNVDESLVSFTKGCFLGQEPISKVHNRSKPTWKLVVREENKCSPEELAKMTSKALDPATGKLKGFVFVKNE